MSAFRAFWSVILLASLSRSAHAGDPLLTLTWTAQCEQEHANFGHSVASAGDVNADGFDDVIVGAPLYDDPDTNEGRAYLYLGSATGLAESPVWEKSSDDDHAQLGNSVASAGDVNGDGHADVIVSVDLYDGPKGGEGRVDVYLGSNGGLAKTPDWSAWGTQENEAFGRAVASAGDVNGDGYDDVVIGALQYKTVEGSEGRASVYLGSPTGLDTAPDWSASSIPYSYFGNAVASAGDVNGDGYGDLVVGAFGWGDDDTGKAFVYLGSASGLSDTAAWETESDWYDSDVGYSVASAGDVDGDGYDDVLVSAPGFSEGEYYRGRADLYRGSSTGVETTASWTVIGDEREGLLGISVAGVGDVNQDGFADVMVGTPRFDGEMTDQGMASLYFGSASGLATTAAWSGYGEQDDAGYGYAVASAGDVDGDGVLDLLVGADRYDNGSTNGGKAFLYAASEAGSVDTDADDDGVDDDEDCDDTDATIYPGAEELCDDAIDNDCDGSVDEDCGGSDDGGGDVAGGGGDDGGDGGGADDDSGCGCSAPSPAAPGFVPLLAILALVRSRRS